MEANLIHHSGEQAVPKIEGIPSIKRILVALDGSSPAKAALQEAVSWAERFGAELTGIFVEDESRFDFHSTVASFESRNFPVTLLQEKIAEENAKVKIEGEDIHAAFNQATKGRVANATMVTVRGNVNDVIIAEARASDLVVMGKRGRKDPPDSKKLGPTTEAVIHEALRPVLVVPEVGNTEGGVLFAFDGSTGVQRVVVPGTALAKVNGKGAVVVTVENDEKKAKAQQQMLNKYLCSHDLRAVYQISHGNPARKIVDAAKANQTGMIVMGAFGHGSIRRFFFGSVTLSVLEHAPCPVLLMA